MSVYKGTCCSHARKDKQSQSQGDKQLASAQKTQEKNNNIRSLIKRGTELHFVPGYTSIGLPELHIQTLLIRAFDRQQRKKKNQKE